MTDQIIAKILENSFTINNLHQRVRILKAYVAKKLFGTDAPEFDEQIKTELNWLSSLGDPFYSQFNPSNFSPIFLELENKIGALPLVVIYFPFEPSQEQLASTGLWLRTNYGPLFIFDAKYDPTLIAGCALVWKGIYKDFSLRAKIAENRDGILGVIKQSIASKQRVS